MIKLLIIPILILITSCYPEPKKLIEIYRFINLSDYNLEIIRYQNLNRPTLKNLISKNSQIEIIKSPYNEGFHTSILDSVRFLFSDGKQILFIKDKDTIPALKDITPFNYVSYKVNSENSRKGPHYLEYTIDKKIYELAK